MGEQVLEDRISHDFVLCLVKALHLLNQITTERRNGFCHTASLVLNIHVVVEKETDILEHSF